jgi:hypothetical protein
MVELDLNDGGDGHGGHPVPPIPIISSTASSTKSRISSMNGVAEGSTGKPMGDEEDKARGSKRVRRG